MIYLAVSVLIFIATVAFYFSLVLRRREQSMLELRERVGGSVKNREEEWVPLQVERDERLSAIPAVDRMLRGLAIARRIELLLYQAGMSMRVGSFILLIAVFGMAGYVVGVGFFHHVLHGAVLMAVLGFAPFFVVNYKKGVRQRQFAEEFPDALDLLVSALRAGISFSAALQIVADESPEPVRSEFAIVVEEQALGMDLREALTNMSNRVGSLDLKFFATAVVLQRAAGGNLTEVLDNTSKLIRDRFRILGDIKTFTSAGRLTGLVLSALPAGMCVFMLMFAPNYFHKMWDLPAGRSILAMAFGLQLLGWLTIRKIVNIRV
ncbi:MAG TPA: type II secretion system F family protein [Candidatus Limnocylindrales bacterium]|nr:type II secretion system F family protein [Candidatus Limnocylindrales bacterium]